mgnify:CR=1 FL=1
MNTIGTAILVLRTDKSGFTGGLDSALKDVRVFKGGVLDVSKALPALGTALAGAFSAAAILAAGKQVIDFAGEVTDLSKRLSISTSTAQEWKATFGAAGVDIGTVAKASEELSKRLLNGDDGAVDALTKMGLRIEELRAMKPEDRLIKVADAVGNIADADERLYASKALFGKGGGEMLAALDGNLGKTIDRMRDLGLVIDEETIKAADDFGDQLGFMGQQLLAIVATVIGPLLPALSALGNVLMWIGRNVVGPVLNVAIKSAMTLLAGFVEVVTGLLSRLAALGTKIPGVGDKFQSMADALADVSARTGKYMQDLWKKTEGTGTAADTAAPKLLGLGNAHDDAGKKAKKHADEAGKLKKELEQLGDKIDDINRSTQAGLWAPKAGEMSDALDGYLADLRDAAEQIDTIRGIQQGGVAGVWNIGVQLDTKDAQAALEALNEEARNSLGGLLNGIVQGLPALLQQAFTGGGGLGGFANAITSQVGSALGSKLFVAGGPLNGLGNKLAGIFGSSFGLALPGIGTALGALVGPALAKLWGALKRAFGGPSEKEVAGRELESAFEASLGGFDAMMAKLGDAYEATGKTREQAQRDVKALLDAEKEGPEAVQAWIDKLRAALDEAAKLRTADAAQAQDIAAQIEKASSEAMKSAEEDLKGLIDERNRLAQGIAAEAPEEIMGVIEAQQRGQLEVLDDEIQKKADTYAQLADETGQKMADAIVEALRGIQIEPITIPVYADTSRFPRDFPSGGYGYEAPEPIPMARGGFGRLATATTFTVGEAGPEDFVAGGAGRNLARDVAVELARVLPSGGATGGSFTIHNEVLLDGEKVAENFERRVIFDKGGLKTALRRELVPA